MINKICDWFCLIVWTFTLIASIYGCVTGQPVNAGWEDIILRDIIIVWIVLGNLVREYLNF